MDEMASRALGTYREIVEDTPEFVPMFQALNANLPNWPWGAGPAAGSPLLISKA